MRTGEPLLVPDTLVEEKWKSNPDVKLTWVSTAAWPEGQIIGTICLRRFLPRPKSFVA